MENEFLILLQAKLDEAKSKGNINTDIKKIQEEIEKLKLQAEIDPKILNNLVKQVEDVLHQKMNIADIGFDQSKISQSARQISNAVSQSISEGMKTGSEKAEPELRKLAGRIENIKNSVDNGYGSSEYQNQINSIPSSSERYGVETENSMRGLHRLGASLKDQMSQAAQGLSQWLSISSAVMLVVSKAKNAVSELKEVNTLLTEISKANDKLSKSDLEKIGNDSFEAASKYGKKATDFLSGVQEASRAGYENAMGIAELSVAAQGAGDMTAELANQYIIATDKAYKLGGSVEKLTEILDGSNYITNHNAVNMTELAEGISVVGSQAASSQMEVNEITAAIGTMVVTTQKSGREMGNAFKGILMNLQQVTGDVGDGENIIDAESLAKYEEACAELGVSLKEVKNGVVSLKEPMRIIKELSEEYNKLDEADAKRENLLNAVGGKYRANALNSLLENYDMYSKMLAEYSQGMGSMAIEAEKAANSWEGSLNRLSNTWSDTIGHIVESDTVITLTNGLNGFLSIINSITDSLGSLGSISLGTGIIAAFKNVGRPKMFGLICDMLNMPTVFGVLSDTKVFRIPDMKYISVNEASICGKNPTLYGTSLLGSNRLYTGSIRRDSFFRRKPSQKRQQAVEVI